MRTLVDQDTLASRLQALDGYLAELEGFRRYDRGHFVESPELYHLAERYLHLACECVLDVAHHVISDTGLRQPKSYREVMTVLEEAGLIEHGLTERLQKWMGFRNILVHFYLEIDHGISYDTIQDELGDLRQFATRMAKLLDG